MLQLSTVELNQEIERLVQENPLLELDDSASSGVEYMGALEAGVEPLSVDLMEIPEEGGKLLAEESPDATKSRRGSGLARG